MRILLDQGTLAPLRQFLRAHDVVTAYELGWAELTNGELLAAAQAQGFDVLVTTDTHLKHQQNLESLTLAVVVLDTTNWPRIPAAAPQVVGAVSWARPGSYAELHIP